MLYVLAEFTINASGSLIHAPQASAKKKRPVETSACSSATEARRIVSL